MGSARTGVWNDGSWGCPQPGSFSTQALEQGMAVIVEVDGVQYDYRFGSGPTPRLCVPLASADPSERRHERAWPTRGAGRF